MSRSTPARQRSLLASILLVAALLLAACGGDGSDGGSDGAEKTPTTGGSTKTTEASDDDGDRPAFIQDMATALEGSGFDDEQITCVLDVAQDALSTGASPEELDASYSEKCDLTNNQVVAGAYYAAMVDKGIPKKDAACVRDLFAALTPEQAAVFTEDAQASASLLEGCNIDPAALAEDG